MKAKTYVIGGGLCLCCFILEIVIWGFHQGLMSLGLITLLVLPAIFIAPRRNRSDRIWIIALTIFLLSLLKTWLLALLQLNEPYPDDEENVRRSTPRDPPPEPSSPMKLLPPGNNTPDEVGSQAKIEST